MQKEVFLAIFIGFLIGLLITFGIWQANKAIKSTAGPTPPVSVIEVSPEVAKPTLSLLTPADEFLSKEAKVTIKGSYVPNSQIVIISEKGEKILESDKDGVFETEISLVLGENQIEVYGFTKEGDEAKQTLTIVYSTAEI